MFFEFEFTENRTINVFRKGSSFHFKILIITEGIIHTDS